ncbi:hypothetical protein RN001_014699 [Aquatica leii]|uniref:Uncharacterized protein n=1 Tax=Aquatica leii TaxID=1421715 RepID=A0AAN7SN86_9COLE|nr:hypothetical protein RN001_014699 [Aquatica leii]
MDALVMAIPTKSAPEIQSAISIYERAAIKSLKEDELVGEERKAPIDNWLKFLKDHSIDVYAPRDIVTALKIIALYEEKTENSIDLKSCYEYLIDLMNGKAPKQLNDDTINFLMSNFGKLGASLKSEDTSKEEEFIKKLQVSDVLQRTYLSKKGNVVGDPSLNLLKVPLNLLKFKPCKPSDK